MGTIEKRGRNSWRVGVQVLTDTGWQWIRETIKMPPGMTEARQRKEAEKALAQLTADANAGRIKPSQSPHTVRSFAAMWMEQHVRPNCKPTTCKDYQFFLDSRILPLIGDIQLKKLTPLILTKWINDVRASGRKLTRLPDEQLKTPRRPSDMAKMASPEKQANPLSARTVQHYYDTLDAMLDKAVQWDILVHNPMDKVDRPKAKKAKAHYLTEERAVELLRCLRHEENMCYRAALLLALLCGLRLGEVGELRLSDVDWKNNTIDISRALIYTPQTGSYAGGTKTEAGERLISLPPGMMAVLHETREYQKEVQTWAGDLWKGEGWIVHGWNGARLHHDTPSKWFRRFADAHGFEGVRFHDLRHPYTEETPGVFVDIGRATGMSPLAVQYLAEQYSGFLGQMVVPALSKDESGNLGGLEATIAAVQKRFTSDPLISTDVVGRVYDNATFLTQVTDAARNGRPADMLRRGLSEAEQKAAYQEAYDLTHKGGVIADAKTFISEGYDRIDEINANDTLSAEQKYMLTSEVRREMIAVALEANEAAAAYRDRYVTGLNIATNALYEGVYLAMPTAMDKLDSTFKEDSDQRYMQQATAVWEATGDDAALPHPNTSYTSGGTTYTVGAEDMDSWMLQYKMGYQEYLMKNSSTWDAMSDAERLETLKRAHTAGHNAAKAWHMQLHRIE